MRAAILLVALLAVPAAAQDAVQLKWSLKEGDKFFVKDDTEMNMTIGVLGMNQEIKMTAVNVQRFKIISAKQDATTVEMTILGMDLKANGNKVPGLSDLNDRVKDATLTAVLDDKMAVTKLEGYGKFIDKMAGDNDALRKQYKQQFSEDAVKQMFTNVFSFGPGKPVKAGEGWTRTDKMSFSGLDATVKMKYLLDSVTSGIAKCTYTGDLTFKGGTAIPGLPAGLQVDKFDMKADKFGGSMKFDTKTGRLTDGNQDADMNGTITLAAGGQKIEMTMKIKAKQKLTVEDKNPLKE